MAAYRESVLLLPTYLRVDVEVVNNKATSIEGNIFLVNEMIKSQHLTLSIINESAFKMDQIK